ncbi:MAG: hypothetical protein ACI4RN_00025 [Oscillospiraceae bacterium]
MADVKLDYSAEEINNLLAKMNSIEYGSFNITVASGNTASIVSKTRTYQKTHTNPKIFLQVQTKTTTSSIDSFSVIAIPFSVNSSSYNVVIFVPVANAPDVVPVPSGTFTINYLIVG